MHREPNNAQITQDKLEVAFSSLERNYDLRLPDRQISGAVSLEESNRSIFNNNNNNNNNNDNNIGLYQSYEMWTEQLGRS